jgi:hypothetical protein
LVVPHEGAPTPGDNKNIHHAAGVYLAEGHCFSHLPIFPSSQLPSFSWQFLMMPRTSPRDHEKEETTDYADYTDFFFEFFVCFVDHFHSSEQHGQTGTQK